MSSEKQDMLELCLLAQCLLALVMTLTLLQNIAVCWVISGWALSFLSLGSRTAVGMTPMSFIARALMARLAVAMNHLQ